LHLQKSNTTSKGAGQSRSLFVSVMDFCLF